jgi:hypothetical protein
MDLLVVILFQLTDRVGVRQDNVFFDFVLDFFGIGPEPETGN